MVVKEDMLSSVLAGQPALVEDVGFHCLQQLLFGNPGRKGDQRVEGEYPENVAVRAGGRARAAVSYAFKIRNTLL